MEYAEEVKRPPAPAAAGPVLKIKKSSLAQQSEFLRSLKGTVSCDAEHVKPELAVKHWMFAGWKAPRRPRKWQRRLLLAKHQHPLKY